MPTAIGGSRPDIVNSTNSVLCVLMEEDPFGQTDGPLSWGAAQRSAVQEWRVSFWSFSNAINAHSICVRPL